MGEVHVSDTRHQNMDLSVWHPIPVGYATRTWMRLYGGIRVGYATSLIDKNKNEGEKKQIRFERRRIVFFDVV